ncbi:jhy protein homolog isoform X1 [Thunnus thynnus]|uniref:jhy protein homolog isoform X1 n=1 Tax=Thunnus thynnus TaxID=8237 RepID=UPI003529760A
MDKELKHAKMYRVLKIEQEKPPFQRRAVMAPQWDAVESDTESLAQERAYQQQLQIRVGRQDLNKYILPHRKNTDILQQGDGEDEDVSDDETEDCLVYDSLEVAAHPHIERNATLLQTEYLDTQRDEREGMSQLLSDDAYSDLRYDPNWRTNLKGADCFNESPRSSVKEYYQIPKDNQSQLSGDRQELVIRGGYRYISDTSPDVLVTPQTAGNECDQLYRLHPQDGQNSHHNHAVQLKSPEADLLGPSSIFTKNENQNTLQGGFKEKHQNSCDEAGEDISRSVELTEHLENVHTMYIQEFQTYYEHELRRTQGGPIQTQQMSTSTLKSPKILSNKKPERLKEDIVERNKLTLGRHTSKRGSYVRVHALKQEMPQNLNKVHETLEETATAEGQEDSSDPELRWLQKTQQLRVTQISKGKKAQRKENPSPSQQQWPHAPGVKAERRDCLSSPLARPAAVTQPKPQKTTSSQPLPPTIHLNINLNTLSQLRPLLQQKAHDAIMNLASLHGRPHWSPGSEVQFGTHMCQEGLHTELYHRNQENSPEQWQSTTALKWPLSCEGEDQKWSSNKPFPQNLPRAPTSTWSQGSGSYTVLPPIGKQVMEKEHEMCPDQSANTTYPIHTSSSDGYLVQMEKQKQLRARVTYKAYSVKDYKQLMPVVTLQGLGPDYTALEKTKMKQQKLYSNVIREQNKKISRIPFLPAKDPEGNDKKVPRMKALEYAKTIAKPPQPKLRQKHQSEGFTEHTPCLEGLDVAQLARLELLGKRHEEEKQAVALFRKMHAV